MTGVQRTFYFGVLGTYTIGADKEMQKFMSSCLTVGGTPEKMFGFGFSDESKIVQTRGDKNRGLKDFPDWLLDKRVQLLKESLGT